MTVIRHRHKSKSLQHCRTASWRLLVAGVAILWICTLSGTAQADCTLRVGWDEWPPYITYQKGHFRGLEYDLLKSTADAAECKLDMQQVPWARALLMLREGKLDLLYGAGYSAERAKFARFSVSYRKEQFVLVTKSELGDGAESVSLSAWLHSPRQGGGPRPLGLFRGNSYGEKIDGILKDNATRVRVVEVNNNEQMVSMLGLGRLDGFIVEEGVARMLVQASPNPMKWHVIEEQVADPLHYMFSLQTSDAVVQRFNKAIRMRQ